MARPYKIKRHKRIYRRSAGSILARAAAIIAAVVVLFGLGWTLYGPVSDWISQKQNGIKPQGFGMQLMGEKGVYFKSEAEKLLAGFKAEGRYSYTM